MKKHHLVGIVLSVVLVSCDPSTLNGIMGTVEASKAPLTNEEIVAGLKEALRVGAKNAAGLVSGENGFLNDPLIRIPFPEEAAKVKQAALSAGLKSKVDLFEANLNHAAEKASTEAVQVFANAISAMTISDAFNILHGSDQAATEYLKKTTSTELTNRFGPIVQKAVDEVQLTALWKPLSEAYNVSTLLTGGQPVNPDLKAYVTQKALDGLFHYVGEEERKIRTNPAARISDILVKVFGTVG